MRALLYLLPVVVLSTGCYTSYRAPGATGRVVDAASGRPVRGARVTRLAGLTCFTMQGVEIPFGEYSAANGKTDAQGRFELPPDARTDVIFMNLPNPTSLTATFVITADGYGTNEVRATATARDLWRAELGKIPLVKP
jgi:hypothetical protein